MSHTNEIPDWARDLPPESKRALQRQFAPPYALMAAAQVLTGVSFIGLLVGLGIVVAGSLSTGVSVMASSIVTIVAVNAIVLGLRLAWRWL